MGACVELYVFESCASAIADGLLLAALVAGVALSVIGAFVAGRLRRRG